jgi:hypothetical protein
MFVDKVGVFLGRQVTRYCLIWPPIQYTYVNLYKYENQNYSANYFRRGVKNCKRLALIFRLETLSVADTVTLRVNVFFFSTECVCVSEHSRAVHLPVGQNIRIEIICHPGLVFLRAHQSREMVRTSPKTRQFMGHGAWLVLTPIFWWVKFLPKSLLSSTSNISRYKIQLVPVFLKMFRFSCEQNLEQISEITRVLEWEGWGMHRGMNEELARPGPAGQ